MLLTNFIARLLVALVLGALIGLERQWRQKSAGLRTNTLVCLGAAAFTLISIALTPQDDGIYKGDVTRVVGQIVTGIGFLGAGVIMRNGTSVQGLNTAATIWCSAAVGALAGAGLYGFALITALLVTLTHLLLRPLGLHLNKLPFQKEELGPLQYVIKLRCKEQVENHLRVMLLNEINSDEHLQLKALRSSDNGSPSHSHVEAVIAANSNHDAEIEKIAAKLTLEYGVTEVSWSQNIFTND
ncbi:MAG: MgtC/SapB family protein [Chitinophagales bacterium]|nr:MgtC/SapB family protein [Chitinophagales bacterium]MDW8274397.1 MgtC/SapB family protein [Chitinophagales bacterium]